MAKSHDNRGGGRFHEPPAGNRAESERSLTTVPGSQRREFLKSVGHLAAAGMLSGAVGAPCARSSVADAGEVEARPQKAQIAITFDLEMSRHYPKRGMTEWDYQKGNLDAATKAYAVRAGELVAQRGGKIHFFCVGRVLEQPDVAWLQNLSRAGHAIGNHTYDHVYVLAKTAAETQFRFRRSPWLARGLTAQQLIRENIRITDEALRRRAEIKTNGFRTPGGFADGLGGREDVQRMLLELGYRWVSSKYPRHEAGEPKRKPSQAIYDNIVAAQKAAQPSIYPTGLVEIPMSPISDVNAFRTKYWKLDWFLEAIRQAVQWAIDRRAVFDFLCHPSCMHVEDPECKTVQLICEMVQKNSDRAELVTLDKIAAPHIK